MLIRPFLKKNLFLITHHPKNQMRQAVFFSDGKFKKHKLIVLPACFLSTFSKIQCYKRCNIVFFDKLTDAKVERGVGVGGGGRVPNSV